MNAAVAEAQRSYAQVFADVPRGHGAPRSSTSGVIISTSKAACLSGAPANAPDYLPGMQLASRVEIETARVSDRSILRREGMYGNFTTRVMLRDLSPAEAAEYRRALTERPLPPDWQS